AIHPTPKGMGFLAGGVVSSPIFGKKGGQVMGINKTRGFLYWLARLLGDVSAVKKGTVGKRVARRLAGRATGKMLRKLFR
ncbi:hypothetical protein HKBW3S25_01545, partial [Candidatus Hakubella thermalkaliphila]